MSTPRENPLAPFWRVVTAAIGLSRESLLLLAETAEDLVEQERQRRPGTTREILREVTGGGRRR